MSSILASCICTGSKAFNTAGDVDPSLLERVYWRKLCGLVPGCYKRIINNNMFNMMQYRLDKPVCENSFPNSKLTDHCRQPTVETTKT